MTDWPAWATAPVLVRPADPQWQRRGEALRRDLDLALARWLTAPVEHVGSTAVPGLAAKPVLDLQAAVVDLGCAPAVAEALAGVGWHLVPPELDARPWRRLLVQAADGVRVAHLHLLPADSRRWLEQLAFRDALRRDPGLAQRYAALKQQLAVEHADDREAYTAAKTDFVRAALGPQAAEHTPSRRRELEQGSTGQPEPAGRCEGALDRVLGAPADRGGSDRRGR